MKSILGCLVQLAEDPMHSDSFHLADPQSGKFDYLIVTTILWLSWSGTRDSMFNFIRKLLQVSCREHVKSFSLV